MRKRIEKTINVDEGRTTCYSRISRTIPRGKTEEKGERHTRKEKSLERMKLEGKDGERTQFCFTYNLKKNRGGENR